MILMKLFTCASRVGESFIFLFGLVWKLRILKEASAIDGRLQFCNPYQLNLQKSEFKQFL